MPNVKVFVKQMKAFQLFAAGGLPSLNPTADAGLLIAMGKCLSAVVYAQLVAENCLAAKVEAPLVSVIFQGLIEDLSTEALKLAALFPWGSPQRTVLKPAARVPVTSEMDLASVSELIATRCRT